MLQGFSIVLLCALSQLCLLLIYTAHFGCVFVMQHLLCFCMACSCAVNSYVMLCQLLCGPFLLPVLYTCLTYLLSSCVCVLGKDLYIDLYASQRNSGYN